MKVRSISLSTAVACCCAVLGTASAANNPFRGVSSTADGYPTWDSDLINIEEVTQTGQGVYIAVLDTGLVPNWADYFPKARVATGLGTGFDQSVTFKVNKTGDAIETEVGPLRQTTWVGSTESTHGTHVASTILGYFYYSNTDAARGFPLPPLIVRGIAPDVTIIPVKVLADYQVPALPHAQPPTPSHKVVFGTSGMVAAGINYATDLAIAGYRPMVISMSLGGPELDAVEKEAIDRAIAKGVIVVAAAGNAGEEGMGYPGAYAPVISVGSAGWTGEWLTPDPSKFPTPYRLWWLQSPYNLFNDIPDPTPVDQVYVSDFSSRELPGQQLDVLAPGSWVRGPFPSGPGFAHLPWWSQGIADLRAHAALANFYYVGGTSMATPHASGVAALMLEKNPDLLQAEVETLLKDNTLVIPPGSASVFDISPPPPGFHTITWGADATGAGLIQADAAVGAVPNPPNP